MSTTRQTTALRVEHYPRGLTIMERNGVLIAEWNNQNTYAQ